MSTNQQKPHLLTFVAMALASILIIYLFNQTAVYLFLSLEALLLASFIMLVYLLVRWRRLSGAERLSIIINVIFWVLVFYGIILDRGLTIRSFLL